MGRFLLYPARDARHNNDSSAVHVFRRPRTTAPLRWPAFYAHIILALRRFVSIFFSFLTERIFCSRRFLVSSASSQQPILFFQHIPIERDRTYTCVEYRTTTLHTVRRVRDRTLVLPDLGPATDLRV